MQQPPYISWLGHGTSNGAPPGKFTGASMHMFVTQGSVTAIQNLVDKLLNAIPVAGPKYKSELGKVIVSFLDIEKCTTPAEVAGWVPGRECAVWVPLTETYPDNPSKKRTILWSPYIFINYAIGLVTGREVWGWPKAIADIAIDTVRRPPSFKCETLLFKHFAMETRGEHAPLVTITSDEGFRLPHLTWEDVRLAGQSIVAAIHGVRVEDAKDPFGLELVIPTIAVKQFRDSENPSLACFQAIIDSPVCIEHFRGAGFYSSRFTVEFTTCDSHRIVQDLYSVPAGQDKTAVPVDFAVWSSFDFSAPAGRVIARAV